MTIPKLPDIDEWVGLSHEAKLLTLQRIANEMFTTGMAKLDAGEFGDAVMRLAAASDFLAVIVQLVIVHEQMSATIVEMPTDPLKIN